MDVQPKKKRLKKRTVTQNKRKSLGEDNLCNKMDQVQEVYSNVGNLIIPSNPKEGSQLSNDGRKDLISLRNYLMKEEREFFNTFKISTPQGLESIQKNKIKDCIAELQSKIDGLNSSGIFNLSAENSYIIYNYIDLNYGWGLNEKINKYEILKELNTNTKFATLRANLIANLVTTSDGYNLLKSTAIEKLNDELRNAKILTDSEKGFRPKNITTSSHSTEIKGFQGLLYYNTTTNKFEFKKGSLDSDVAHKLKELFDIYPSSRLVAFGKGRYKDFDDTQKKKYQKQLLIAILKFIRGKEMKSAVRKAFNDNKDQLVFSFNKSSLDGALGELQFTAIMYYLTGQQSKTKLTGAVQDSINRQQINIDALLYGYGIQIKNYTPEKTKPFKISGNIGAASFIKNRAQMPNQKELINYFAAYQYNQPFSRISNDKIFDKYLPTQPIYMDLYDNYKVINKLIENICKYYAAQIIGINRSWEPYNNVGSDMFKEGSPRLVLFWYIGNKIYPSSVIVEAMIYSLKKQIDYYESSFKISEEDELNKKETLAENILTNSKNWNHQIGSPSEKANNVKIDYNVNFDPDEVLKQLLIW